MRHALEPLLANPDLLLVLLAWFGDACAVLGSYMIGGGNNNGWWAYLVADFSLIGIQIHHRIWNQVVLFIVFIALGIRGIVKSGLLG